MSWKRRGTGFPALMLGLGLALSAPPMAADNATEARYAAVSALGSLNGVALQCRYLDAVRRLKFAVVEHAPKERSYGLAFESATNEAFLEFRREGATCPHPATFERRVDEAVTRLGAAFAPADAAPRGASRP